MDSYILYQGSATFRLLQRDDDLLMKVEDSRTLENVEFPVQLSLLKAILSGFSYQVANGFGSLHIHLKDRLVILTFHLNKSEKLQAKIAFETYSEAIEQFARL